MLDPPEATVKLQQTGQLKDPEAASHLEMMLFLCPGEGTAAGHHHFEQLDQQQQHCESLVEGFGTLGQRSWEQSADANLHDVRVCMVWMFIGIGIFPECVARVPVSLWGSGGWGCVRSTLLPRPQPFATVRVRTVWPCLWEVLQRWSFLEVSDVWLLRFAWQAWHFVTFRRVLERVESRFAWQAQYFCDVFRRCVAIFVGGAALWARPSSFFVAGAAL